MFHEIENKLKNDGNNHWYVAFIIIDYNGYDENNFSATVFKLLLMKLHSNNLEIEWK